MASNSVDVGTYGEWFIDVTETATSAANNTSTVLVRCYMKNNGTSTSYNNSGVDITISGQNSDTATNVPFNVSPGAKDLVYSKSFTVTHNSDGKKTVSYTAKLGTTGTTLFGSGGTVSVSLVLTNLATEPAAPTLSVIDRTNTTVTLKLVSNGTGGSSITDLRVRYSSSSSTYSSTHPGVTWDPADGWTVTITGLTKNTTYNFWSLANNAVGWSDISNRVSQHTDDVPSAPGAPAISAITQVAATGTITDNSDNGGSTVVERQIVVSTINGTTDSTKFVAVPKTTGKTASLTPLPPGTTLYAFARTRNEYGWSLYSAATTFKTVAGVWINVAGVWKQAIPYARVAGVWVVVEPWARSNGVWGKCG